MTVDVEIQSVKASEWLKHPFPTSHGKTHKANILKSNSNTFSSSIFLTLLIGKFG